MDLKNIIWMIQNLFLVGNMQKDIMQIFNIVQRIHKKASKDACNGNRGSAEDDLYVMLMYRHNQVQTILTIEEANGLRKRRPTQYSWKEEGI